MSVKGFKHADGNIEKYDIDSLYTSFTSDVGQVLSVDEVDGEGKPIKWKTIEQSSGEGGDITIDEDGYLVCDGEGEGESSDVVRYTEQILTDEQKTQARKNISAASEEVVNQLSEDLKGRIQVDWNQHDSAAPDYIKNRPFWAKIAEPITVVDNVTIESEDGWAVYIVDLGIDIDDTCVVIIDGVEYTNITYYIDEVGFEFESNDTPVCFYYCLYDGEWCMDIYELDDGEHTISVKVIKRDIKKIESKYLPTPVLLRSMYGDMPYDPFHDLEKPLTFRIETGEYDENADYPLLYYDAEEGEISLNYGTKIQRALQVWDASFSTKFTYSSQVGLREDRGTYKQIINNKVKAVLRNYHMFVSLNMAGNSCLLTKRTRINDYKVIYTGNFMDDRNMLYDVYLTITATNNDYNVGQPCTINIVTVSKEILSL